MEEVKDIVLNVYSLSIPSTTEPPSNAPSGRNTGSTNGHDARNTTTTTTTNTTTNNNSSSSNSWTSFFVGKMLPSMGMGAYHTSLRIGAEESGPYVTTYTFVANRGIVQEKRQRNSSSSSSLPAHATFKEEIVLGSCTCQRGQVNEIIQILSQYYFTNTSYHLVHRNCNHFTETFATALIHYQEFIDLKNNWSMETPVTRRPLWSRKSSLTTYPDWINRLAHTGANVISHDTDIIPCHPYHEAYHAVTKTTMDGSGSMMSNNHRRDDSTDKTTGRWGGFSLVLPGGSKSNTTASTATTTSNRNATSSSSSSKPKKNEKKELTEAQKKLLEKIRKK